MILIPCPNCGLRNATEFRWCGELIKRPDPASTDQIEWRNYLYFRKNLAGWGAETWYHRAGCGQYFRVERNTMTDEFRSMDPHHAAIFAEDQESGTD